MTDDLESYWRVVNPKPGGRSRPSWLKGQFFGRLRVIERVGTDKHGASLWRCICRCGNEKIVPRGRLVSGRVKSCGCLAAECCARTATCWPRKPTARATGLPGSRSMTCTRSSVHRLPSPEKPTDMDDSLVSGQGHED